MNALMKVAEDGKLKKLFNRAVGAGKQKLEAVREKRKNDPGIYGSTKKTMQNVAGTTENINRASNTARKTVKKVGKTVEDTAKDVGKNVDQATKHVSDAAENVSGAAGDVRKGINTLGRYGKGALIVGGTALGAYGIHKGVKALKRRKTKKEMEKAMEEHGGNLHEVAKNKPKLMSKMMHHHPNAMMAHAMTHSALQRG